MKTLFISALALFLSSQLFAQQWEKIQYPEIYYTSKKQNIRNPTLVVHNNIIIALPNNSLPLYTSKDNGSTWQMCDTNALKNLGLVHNGVLDWYISSIDFTKSAAFASISTYNGKVSRNFLGRSRDNGQTWQFIDLSTISQNAIDSNVYSVTADDRTVIVSTGDSYNTNLFISTDEGDTWKEMALPRNTVNANGQIALFQNSFMYEGRFYDGKEFISTGGAYNGRFLLFQDINNLVSQKLSDFPKWADLSQKKEYYVDCNRLGITGHHFTCEGDLPYIDGKWQYRATISPDPMYLLKDVEYYEKSVLGRLWDVDIIPNNYVVLGSNYDTPGNIFYCVLVRRKSDSALVHRYIKHYYPYNKDNFEIIADDFVLPNSKTFGMMPLIAATDNAFFIGTSKDNLYRFQKSSVSVDEQVFDATKTLTLQPNPAKEQIHISFDTPVSGIYTCELHDMMGASIASLGSATLDKGQQWNFEHDIHTLPNGYYRLIIKHQSQVFSVPCIIHK